MDAKAMIAFEFFHHNLLTQYAEDPVLDVAADALVMPLTHPMIAKVTGGDAEALTLADGIPGQTLTINLVTDGGGKGTITPATATWWATVELDDAGDQVTFGYVDDVIGWIILSTFGLTAQPTVTV